VAIVTVKLNIKQTNEKQSGRCPVSPFCTDKNGGHHSYIEKGNSIEDIERRARIKYGHITRIEVVSGRWTKFTRTNLDYLHGDGQNE
jgi:hypothetical protein